jgi:sulfate adenylyltransferase large subunit
MATANQNVMPGEFPVPAPQSSPVTRKLLRFTTAGSVDDGKSTLIGRLLYDSQAIYEDQLSSVRNSRINRSSGPIDFSLLTDGLRAEREQGITIDVAYRYFSTPRRKFIIADTPGHEQYTRNMVTGASTADAAIVLIDAAKGVLPQTRRHSYISSLLGIRAVIAAVNKMDLVDYSEQVFRSITTDLQSLSEKLGLRHLYVIPISALEGDNIVRRSNHTPWFTGPTLLHYLEELDLDAQASKTFRFPVQYVIRPDAQFRGFAGQVESGSISVGDPVTVLPSKVRATVRSLESFDGPREQVSTGEPITITLNEEVDVSRGDLFSSNEHPPTVSQRFQANLVWMNEEALNREKLYVLKHTTRSVRARVIDIKHRVEINSLSHSPAQTLKLNDIGVAELSTTLPIFFDPYVSNRAMGSFVLVDPITNATVAAGMIQSAVAGSPSDRGGRVTTEERIARHGHPPAVVHIQGSSRIADQVERALFDDGWHAYLVKDDDYNEEQLTTLLGLLQTTGAVVVLFGSATLAPQTRALFKEAVFTFRKDGEPDSELSAEILRVLRHWRSSSENSSREQ